MDVISSDWESLFRLALKGKVAYLDSMLGCRNLLGDNAGYINCRLDFANNLKTWVSVYQSARASGIPKKALRNARCADLLSVAFRDLRQIFKGGAVLARFKYLYHGSPVFKTFVILRLPIHPYIWVKCGINTYRRIMKRIGN